MDILKIAFLLDITVHGSILCAKVMREGSLQEIQISVVK